MRIQAKTQSLLLYSLTVIIEMTIPNKRHTVLLYSGRKEILKGLGINKKNDYPAEAVRQTGIDTGMQNHPKDFQESKGQL